MPSSSTTLDSLPVYIETDKGEFRHWKDPHDGSVGKTRMLFPYGFIRGTKGADGEEVDVYVGPDSSSDRVYVIHQMKAPDFVEYDEDKVMVGFTSAVDAKTAYLQHYNNARFFGNVTEMSMADLKEKLRSQRGQILKGKMADNGFTTEEASKVAKLLKVDLANEGISLKEFQNGLNEELEHKDITHEAAVATGKIALAHLREDPNYYSKLATALSKSTLINHNNSDRMDYSMLYLDLEKANDFKPVALKPGSEVGQKTSYTVKSSAVSELKNAQGKLKSLAAPPKTVGDCDDDNDEDDMDLKKKTSCGPVEKALKASAIAGLSRRERLGAAYLAGMSAGRHDSSEVPELQALDHAQLGIGMVRPVNPQEPPPVPVRTIHNHHYIEPVVCEEVAKTPEPIVDQQALPFWRR